MSPRPPPTAPPAPPPSRPAPRSLASSRLAKTDPSRRSRKGAPSNPTTPAERAARNASYALLAFTLFTLLALGAWFATADQPWGFSSFLAILTALLGTGATALLWRQPTREHAMGGLAVMGVSLLRVGLPTSWTMSSLALVMITALLAIPLVQAVIVLPRS